jgi:hypothetical protein
MQTVTWSPQLSNAVRKFKKLDMYKGASSSNEQKMIDTYRLSVSEEQAVKSIMVLNTESKSVNTWW